MFKDLFSLQGRVALVTGGSRGIGKMIAAGFLAQGAAKVYITARKAGPCEATAKELSAPYDGECIALPIDISTLEGCDMLAAEIIKLEPKLDILVNNAGAAWGAEFDEFPESGWDKVMDLNVKSPFFLTKALAKPLRAAASHERPAKVINIASIDGIFVNPSETYSYAASKAAVIHLTRRMAMKLIKDHINVTAIAPGAFASDMNRAARDHADEVARAFRRGASAPTRTWQALRSTSPRAPAITWSATPSRSMAAWSMRMRGWRSRGKRRRATHSAVMPRRKRGIQYAAASRLEHNRLWNTGSPAFAGDRQSLLLRRARGSQAASRLDLHVLEIAGLVVDADLGRRDPGGELAGLGDRLSSARR